MESKRDLTLLVVKPDAVRRKLVGEIIRRVESDGFTIRDVRFRHLTTGEARQFYAIHKGKDFYDDKQYHKDHEQSKGAKYRYKGLPNIFADLKVN